MGMIPTRPVQPLTKEPPGHYQYLLDAIRVGIMTAFDAYSTYTSNTVVGTVNPTERDLGIMRRREHLLALALGIEMDNISARIERWGYVGGDIARSILPIAEWTPPPALADDDFTREYPDWKMF